MGDSHAENIGVSAGKSFLLVFRIFFVVLSAYFFIDVFVSKWGGYSYYMRFIDFLPGLSLSYILWTVMVFLIALVVWLMTYGVIKLLPASFRVIRFEHLFAGLLIALLLLTAKGISFRIASLIGRTGLSNFTLIIILLVFVTAIVFIIKNFIDRLLHEIDNGISLLVWLFTIFIIAALPLSFIKTDYGSQNIPVDCSKISEPASIDGSVSRPNIILVTMDSLTSMDMQSYGYDRPTTPFISKWSEDAVVFKESYSSSIWTPSAVMSIMTSKRVWTHGIWHRAKIFPVKPYRNNFPSLLKANGYGTFGFVQSNMVHPVTMGMGESFSVKVNPKSMLVPKTWWFDKLSELFIERPVVMEMVFEANAFAKFINKFRPDMDVYDSEFPAEAVYNGFLDCISQYNSENSRRPFFAWLHVFPPHSPYLPPKPYRGFFGDANRFLTLEQQKKVVSLDYPEKDQPDVDILRKRYDEFILYADKQFEIFISRLSERIDMSNTIIILSGDHGQSFSHGVVGHISPHLYEEVVRVPLIFKLPGEGHGREIDVPVESIDIAPSILKLAGIPIPDWMEGVGLLPLSEGEEIEHKPVFVMQFNKNLSLGRPLKKGTVAVREGDYKLIYYLESGKKVLFDLGADPYERKDISGDEEQITEHLMELIKDKLSEANEKIKETSLSK